MRDEQRYLSGFAKQLRKEMTDTERGLWQALRGKQLDGQRFRRQAVIGPYIADFVCLEKRLIVEVDGGQHQEAAAYDARRDEYLRVRGYQVLRFWNNEVNENLVGVLETILAALTAPHPNPPPHAEEGTTPLPPPAGEGWDGGGVAEERTS